MPGTAVNERAARARVLWGELPLGEPHPGQAEPRGGDEPRAIIAGHFAAEQARHNGRVLQIDAGAGLDVSPRAGINHTTMAGTASSFTRAFQHKMGSDPPPSPA